jgi:nicotinic acid mononucleotide adenylyltransferase
VLVEMTSLPTYDTHLTSYIFKDVRKRIDLALMWVYKNYFNIKELHAAIKELQETDNIKMEEEMVEVLNSSRQTIDMELKKAEIEYDRTLYTILYNLQQRQDQKDLYFIKSIRSYK